MRNASYLLGVSAATMVTAQVTFNETTGTYTCSTANAAFCAGDSLLTDIIIRCNAEKVGFPGRCSDNLVGQFPLGVNPAFCYETSKTAGDAVCEKNCIVYADPTFTLPQPTCTPYATSMSSTSSATSMTTTSTSTTRPTTTGGPSPPPPPPPPPPGRGTTVTQIQPTTISAAPVPPTTPPSAGTNGAARSGVNLVAVAAAALAPVLL